MPVKIDPRSDRIALHYTGSDAGEPAIGGVPARDLTENDVARLVYIEHGDLSGAAYAAATEKLLDRLNAGPYRRTPKTRATARETVSSPAGPAELPAPTPAPEPDQPITPAAEPASEPEE